MNLSHLNAISPIDGRYRSKTEIYTHYFSEFALIRYRVLVEVEYFIALCEIPLPQLKQVPSSIFPKLRLIYTDFNEADAQRIKDIEKETNHDVKAVEYFLKEKFKALQLDDFLEFIHFGLTSQDINNTSIPISINKPVSIAPEIRSPILTDAVFTRCITSRIIHLLIFGAVLLPPPHRND